MNKILNLGISVVILSLFTNCSSWKSDKPTVNANHTSDSKTLFEKVSYYRDFELIQDSVTNPIGPYYFKRLLAIYLSDSTRLNESQAVAILFGALNHPGYNNSELTQLEFKADSFLDEAKYNEAITVANKCIDIFPLSAKALKVNWSAYLNLEKTDSSDLYGNRLGTIFKGMQASGFSNYPERGHIALSKNAVEEYCNLHAAGAGLEFEKEYLDELGNLIVIYSSSIVGQDFFIIPSRK